MKINFLTLLLIFIFYQETAHAYIGPGIAIGSVVLMIGIIGILLLAILAILYYPIKKMIKKFKLKNLKKNK